MKHFISLLIVIVVIVGFFIWLYGLSTDSIHQEQKTTILPQPASPTSSVMSQGQRQILSQDGFIQITDITIDPIKTYEGDVVVFSENDDFSLLYYERNDQFLITLKQTNDFSFARLYAEETFLKKLGITQKQACSIAVDVVIPSYIDFDLAGSYGLSFCPGAIAVP